MYIYIYDALKKSGYNNKLNYVETENNQNTRNNRKRNIIWYNPPFSLNVETSIAKNFLHLIDKHFKDHRFSKIFNRNNIKVSYSCLPNLDTTIKSHNINLQRNTTPEIHKCNCRNKESCPLNGNCLTKSLVYSGKVDCTRNEDTYVGLTENTFKDRLYKHKNSFKYRSKNNYTELSKCIWDLKDRGTIDVNVKWDILAHATPYQNGAKNATFVRQKNITS